MMAKRSQSRLMKAGQALAITLLMLTQEKGGQGGNVLTPFPQRWQMDFDRVKPKEQVRSKTTCGDFSSQIGIRR